MSRKKNTIALTLDISKLDLKTPKKERPRTRVNKEEVLSLHGNKCKICSKSGNKVPLEMAHYIAHSKNGTQYIPLCPTCHTKYDKGMLKPSELKKLNITKESYVNFLPKGRTPVALHAREHLLKGSKLVTRPKSVRKHYICIAKDDKPCDWVWGGPERASGQCLEFNDGKKCPNLRVE